MALGDLIPAVAGRGCLRCRGRRRDHIDCARLCIVVRCFRLHNRFAGGRFGFVNLMLQCRHEIVDVLIPEEPGEFVGSEFGAAFASG